MDYRKENASCVLISSNDSNCGVNQMKDDYELATLLPYKIGNIPFIVNEEDEDSDVSIQT